MAPRILVIHDDDSTLKLVCGLLAGAGYDIVTRCRASLDLRELEQIAPDLMLLDWRADHEAASWQVFKWVKYYPPTAHIPVLLCAPATPTVQAVSGFLRTQGVVVVDKPVTHATLHAALLGILQPDAGLMTRAVGAEVPE